MKRSVRLLALLLCLALLLSFLPAATPTCLLTSVRPEEPPQPSLTSYLHLSPHSCAPAPGKAALLLWVNERMRVCSFLTLDPH